MHSNSNSRPTQIFAEVFLVKKDILDKMSCNMQFILYTNFNFTYEFLLNNKIDYNKLIS